MEASGPDRGAGPLVRAARGGGARLTARAAAYPALLVLGAVDAAGYSVIAPVLPAISEATGAGPAVIGALVAAFPVGILLGFPVAGRGVQRRGATAVLLPSLGLLGVGSLGFVLGQGLPGFFVSRFLMGLGSGGLWIGVTFGTLERWPGQEYRCMSRIFAAYSVGGLVGPALGAIPGIRGPFAAYLGLLGLGAVAVLLVGPAPQRRAFRADRTALRLPGFWLASASIMFAVLGLGITEGVLPLHFADELTQAGIGALYVGMSIVLAVGAAAAGRFAPRRMVLASAALTVAGLWVAGATGGAAWWILALIAAGAGIGIGNTGSIGVLLDAVHPERIVTALVVWSQLGILGYLAGPLVGGAVAQALGFGSIGLVPLTAALVLLVAFRLAGHPAPTGQGSR